jgi:lipid II:glycine glycyltransferase (peptidoglycan interpeptide bridge formation enzyme)
VIRELGKRRKTILLKIDPDISKSQESLTRFLENEGFQQVDKGKNFEGVQPKFVFRLDISPDEESVFNSFHSKTRYNIRLATKKGVTIKTDCTKADLPAFYEVLKETTERDNFLVRSYSYFEDMYDYLVPAGMAKLFLAEFEGKVIAGTLALNIGEKAWYLYGASSNSYRNVMPNYLIQWTMIQWAKSLGCTLYDFRGVPGDLSEDNPLHGLYRFKKGFNGEYTQFVGEYDLVYSKALYAFWNVAEPLYYGGVRKLIGWVRGK